MWIKRLLRTALVTALSIITAFNSQALADSKKVLMVISSYGENQGEDKPGYEFDELSKAYLTFRDNGVVVTLASPKGGKVEADKYNVEKAYNKAFMADAKAMSALENTLPMSAVDSKDYDGIFVVGGKGAMFDLPKDEALKGTIAEIYEAGGTVGAVCHGPAAFVDVQLSNGKYLVEGKRVNGFTNQEEKMFGKKWVPHFPFMLEDKLKERKGEFTSSPMLLSHVAIDGRLITGQNPNSTVDAAKAMLKTMGITPNEGNVYSDDETLKLVAEILNGNKEAIKTYEQNKAELEPELMGLYGYYLFMAAGGEKDIRDSITLMNLAQVDMQHPAIAEQIEKATNALETL